MRYIILLLPISLLTAAWYFYTPPVEQELNYIEEALETSFLETFFEEVASTDTSSEEASVNLYPVVRVVDGDTIKVLIDGTEKTVRYIGIDTPETVHPEKPVQCFGMEASAKNKALVEGAYVRLERDISDVDKYGRLLRYVYVGDTFINYELVAQGYARSLTYPPDVAYNELIREAENTARVNGLGLWSADCSNVNAATGITSSSCTIKGNISSSGNKLFHTKTCPDYEAVTIYELDGERFFCSEDEAFAAGWRKAGNCRDVE